MNAIFRTALLASLAFLQPGVIVNPVALPMGLSSISASGKTHAEIGIYGEIDINALSKLDLELAQISSNPPDVLIVVINSPGGFVSEGMMMAKHLREYQGRVVCMVDHDALSMAFLLLQTCQTRYIVHGGVLMAHEPAVSTTERLDRYEVAKILMGLEFTAEQMLLIYATRLSMTIDEIRERIHGQDWWMKSDEAVQFGAADQEVDSLSDGIKKALETVP